MIFLFDNFLIWNIQKVLLAKNPTAKLIMLRLQNKKLLWTFMLVFAQSKKKNINKIARSSYPRFASQEKFDGKTSYWKNVFINSRRHTQPETYLDLSHIEGFKDYKSPLHSCRHQRNELTLSYEFFLSLSSLCSGSQPRFSWWWIFPLSCLTFWNGSERTSRGENNPLASFIKHHHSEDRNLWTVEGEIARKYHKHAPATIIRKPLRWRWGRNSIISIKLFIWVFIHRDDGGTMQTSWWTMRERVYESS